MSSTPLTADQILASLGIITVTGEIIIGGVRSISTDVGLAAPIQTLMVIDVGAIGAATATVTLTTLNNPLTMGTGAQGTVKQSSNGRTMTIAGTLGQVNADLALLSYVSGFAGSDTVTLSVVDSAGTSKSASFSVSVLPTATNAGAPTVADYVQPTSIGQAATLSGANQIYTASDKTDIVNAVGTASSVTGGSAGSALTLVQTGGTYDFTNKAGAATLVAVSAPGTIQGGAAGSTLVAFLQSQPTSYIGGFGNDELIGGSGAMTVHGGGGGNLTVFGGTGTLQLTGGHDHETVVGGSGAETIFAAASGGAYFGGSGGSQMTANGAGTFLIGAVGGDRLTTSTFGSDGLVAGAGNETLNGGGSRWQNVLFGGSGTDTVMLGAGDDTFVGGTGSDVIQMGAGSASMFVGSGSELFTFDAAHTGGSANPGSNMITGFRTGVDFLHVSGGLSASSYASTGGMTSIQLTDGTQIHLAGVSGVKEASLFT